MISNLKVLGLAFIAVLAVSATAAAGAGAVPLWTASSYPATVTGSNSKGSEVLSTEGGKVECDSHYQGTLAAASSELELTPTYTNCEAFGFLESTAHMNGCKMRLYGPSRVGWGHYSHRVNLVCPAGSPGIQITTSTCVIDIPPQKEIKSITTLNFFPIVRITFIMTSIKYIVTKDGFLCSFSGTGEKTGGTYSGEVDISRAGGGGIEVSGE